MATGYLCNFTTLFLYGKRQSAITSFSKKPGVSFSGTKKLQ
jgi:hypothetical protein